MQRRIQRSLLDLENLAGDLPDPFRDPPAMLRLEVKGLENQQVQSALRKVDVRQNVPLRFYNSILVVFPVEVQGQQGLRKRNFTNRGLPNSQA